MKTLFIRIVMAAGFLAAVFMSYSGMNPVQTVYEFEDEKVSGKIDNVKLVADIYQTQPQNSRLVFKTSLQPDDKLVFNWKESVYTAGGVKGKVRSFSNRDMVQTGKNLQMPLVLGKSKIYVGSSYELIIPYTFNGQNGVYKNSFKIVASEKKVPLEAAAKGILFSFKVFDSTQNFIGYGALALVCLMMIFAAGSMKSALLTIGAMVVFLQSSKEVMMFLYLAIGLAFLAVLLAEKCRHLFFMIFNAMLLAAPLLMMFVAEHVIQGEMVKGGLSSEPADPMLLVKGFGILGGILLITVIAAVYRAKQLKKLAAAAAAEAAEEKAASVEEAE